MVAICDPVVQATKACAPAALTRSICAVTLTSLALKCGCSTILTAAFSGSLSAASMPWSASCPVASVLDSIAMRVHPRSRK